MQLYSYFRSSASYRVRIALAIKGIQADSIPINLLKNEQKNADYVHLNPQGLVPMLIDGEYRLTQSLAIMEYLDEAYPNPPLLPQTPYERARLRAIALAIACEIAPLNNIGVLNYLKEHMNVSDEQKTLWIRHWIGKGFTAVERMLLGGMAGTYCHGASPGLADCVLVPQIFNARRFGCDLAPYPTILRIAEACERHPAFIAAHPSRQKDAVT